MTESTLRVKPRRPQTLRYWRDGSGEYRWQRKAGNGRVVGASTQGYNSKRAMLANAERQNPDLLALRVVDEMGGRMGSLSRKPEFTNPDLAISRLKQRRASAAVAL